MPDAETNLTAIQNWADLLVEFGVTNAGMAALARVCMKSMRPIERKAALRKSAWRSWTGYTCSTPRQIWTEKP